MLPRKILLDDLFYDFKEDKDMKCDIYEKNGIYVVEASVPGFKKEDISIEIDKGNLTITAQKKEENKEDRNYIRRERSFYGKYQRSFYLGDVDEEKIKASFNEGILNISIPKKEAVETKRKVEID